MQLIKEKTPARFTYVGLIFVNPTYGEQRAGDKPIRERWCRILLVAGVRDRTPYQTRHTFASSCRCWGPTRFMWRRSSVTSTRRWYSGPTDAGLAPTSTRQFRGTCWQSYGVNADLHIGVVEILIESPCALGPI